MKIKLIAFFACLSQAALCTTVFAQKKLLTNNSQDKWGYVDEGKISNDGKYIFYTQVENGAGKSVLTAANRSWSKNFPGYNAAFTQDSQFIFYQIGTDTLVKFNLAKKTSEYILHVGFSSFKISPPAKTQFIVYKSGKDVVLQNLATGKETRYADVVDYRFNPAGNALLLRTKETLLWIALPGVETKSMARLPKVADTKFYYKFDNSGDAIALTIANKKGNNIYYYKAGMDSGRLVVASHPEGTKAGARLVDGTSFFGGQSPIFTPDGKSMIFKIKEAPEDIQRDTDLITDKVDVWNYKDANLQSQQLQMISSGFDPTNVFFNPYTTAIIPVTGGKWIQLDDKKNVLFGTIGNRYAILKSVSNDADAYWYKSLASDYSIISMNDGRRTVIGKYHAYISPGEKFVTWFDTESRSLMCYEIATGTTRNISKNMPVPAANQPPGVVSEPSLTITNWLTGDARLFVEDDDIWELDPKGLTAPVNITRGYGHKNHIRFRFLTRGGSPSDTKWLLAPNQELLLVAQDQQTMDNGFFRIRLGSDADPVKLDMGPYNYYEGGLGALKEPLKAKNAEVYLVKRMTASDAPNYFVSRDLKNFIRLTNVQPQKDYNWMTSELILYPKPDGRIGKAILYKPENFDPGKKYPVIFHYYQERSYELHNYLTPDLSQGQLNVPWYVSNGYLVCIPDIINDKPGYIAETTINSVVSAAKYLCRNPWVDSTKMGIQGHSFGGYETNILLSRTNIFAAAQPSSPPSNLISCYASLGFGGGSLISFAEVGEFDMRATIWERPDLYREASPLLYLDKVTTPVLIEHSKKDGTDEDGGGVPFSQSTELFTALRRLQKPVWLLQYDGAGHILGDPEQQLDFTIRQHQFFDHYLKGKPAPKWMTEGIDAKYKGLKSGLQLDTSGKQP